MSIPGAANPLLLRTAAAGGYQISRSLRFNSSDSAYLSRAVSTAGNRKTFTFACWVKLSSLSTLGQFIFTTSPSSATDAGYLYYSNNQFIYWDRRQSADQTILATNAVYRDPSAWYHVVLSVNYSAATSTDRAKIYVNGIEQTYSTATYPSTTESSYFNVATTHYISAPGGYVNAYLADIHFIDGQALTPSSFTEVSATTGQLIPKQYTGSFGTNGFWLKFSDNSAATATTLGKDYSGNNNNWTPNNLLASVSQYSASGYRQNTSSTNQSWNSSSTASSTSSQLDEDEIFWMDLGSTVSTNYIKVDVSLTNTDTNPANYFVYYSNDPSSLGGNTYAASWSVSGGATTGSFTLTLQGSTVSGRYFGIANGNGGTSATFTYSNFRVFSGSPASVDSLVDTPSSAGTDTGLGGQVTGNYCTWNPLETQLNLTNGNLDVDRGISSWASCKATIGLASGKWYYEYTVNSGSSNQMIGVFQTSVALPAIGANGYMTVSASGWGYQLDGNKSNANSFTGTGTTATAGDVLMVAFDVDAGKIWFGKNGTWIGSGAPASGTNAAFTNLSGTISPAVCLYGAQSGSVNFGARVFAYQAPSGFRPIVDTLLPAPVVAKPSTVMDVKLYTGTGAAQTVSGLGFSPDLVWIKKRSASGGHILNNSVVGTGTGKALYSNTTDAAGGNDVYGYLSALTSDGFTTQGGTDPSFPYDLVGANSATYVAWAWDAGSSTVTNTQGSITSQVRANASAGFSIITFTMGSGSYTVGHGLGITPSLLITKGRNLASNWWVYHASLGASQYLGLNQTAAAATLSWGASPTSTVFTANNNFFSNGYDHVVYAFSPVAGYSSFGSYTGGTQGTFVYLGFTPKWLLVKSASGSVGDNWKIYDSSRSPYNVRSDFLAPNTSGAEVTANLNQFDFVSNGFVVRTNPAYDTNFASTTYIYAAFAESPFQYARAR